jgi:copper/silver efflux system protein
MLTTGLRTPVGIKVFGDDLAGIERLGIELEGLLRDVPGTRSTFAERQSGREYIDIEPDRAALARHGLSVRELHETIELAIGGMPITTTVDGRTRQSINLRYAADFRSDVDALRRLPIAVPATEPLADQAATPSGRGSSPPGAAMPSSGGGMAGMGSGGEAMSTMDGVPGLSVSGMSAAAAADEFAPATSSVPLGVLADVRIVTGPPMIKNENGQLVGYVFADIDSAQRDLGGWVEDARRRVDAAVALPPGYRLEWTGQYAFLADMQARLLAVIPLTLLLVVGLLYLSLRGWPQTLLVLLSVPFAVVGSIWLLAALGYNLSTATWVGLIAVAGVAGQTAIVVLVYLDQAFREAAERGIANVSVIDGAVIEGAVRGVRPMVMTVATTVLGLMPLMWTSGVGADLSARTAAPVVGGMLSALVLTLLVLPAAYAIWRRAQWRGTSPAEPRAAHVPA